MSDKIKGMRERRGQIAHEIRRMADTLNETKNAFTAEERGQWDRLNAEFDGIGRQLEVHERTASIDKLLARRSELPPGFEGPGSRRGRRAAGQAAEKLQGLALRGWLRRTAGRTPTEQEQRAARAVGISLGRGKLDIRLGRPPGGLFRNASQLGVGSTSTGGGTVPQGFVNSLERALAAFGGIRSAADVIRTDTGAALPWPTVNDTGNSGELLAENTAATDNSANDPTFGQTTFGAYKFSSKVIRISYELIEDSAFDMPSRSASCAASGSAGCKRPTW
jgi:HK97 family phage major capsid protein